MQPFEIAFLVFSAAIGACVGSFINAAALRAVRNESFVKGRSRCPGCSKTLQWFELIPLLSYTALRGKCRACAMTVSPRYPVTEAICSLLAALCFLNYRFSFMTPLVFAVCAVLLAVSLVDMDTMEIPDMLIIALIPLAVAAIWAEPGVTLLHRGIGFAAVSLPMLIVARCVDGGFGGGDIKLMAVCGFIFGWQRILLAFFLALIIGVIFALIKKKKKGEHFAFGPSLCAGSAAAILYGDRIINAYLDLFGLQWLV
jgi:leader peptidase (prepilin peptidase)/N-methyltransferase